MQLHDDELYEQPNKKALLQQLGGPVAGSVTGMAAPAESPIDPPLQPQAAPKYGTDIGKREYMDWRGIDAGKFDSAHDSPKYQVLRTLSHFDPSQGITADVLGALNQLGLGTFSGERDKLRVGGQVDPRFEGYTEMDLIQGFNDPNNKTKTWGYGAINPNQPQGGAPSMGGVMPGMGGGLNPLLTGDPMAGIQAAIGQYAKPSSNLQALLAQLGGR